MVIIQIIVRVNYGKPYIFAGQRKGLSEGDVLLDGIIQVDHYHYYCDNGSLLEYGARDDYAIQ